MKKLVLKRDKDLHMSNYSDDIERLRKVLEDRGYEASDHDIYEAWCKSSEDSAAGWLRLDEDDYLNSIHVMRYLVEEE